MAISWFDVPGIEGIELRDTAGEVGTGEVRTIDAERVGPVTRVLLDGLEPGSTYAYRALTTDSPDETEWRTFATAPRVGEPASGRQTDSRTSLQFAVAGDLQPFNEETVRTTRLGLSKIASLDPAFVVQVGDVAEVGISRRSWRLTASVLSIAGDEIPIVATAGNHDYYYGLPSVRYFKSFFPAPYAGGDSLRRNTWYSLTVGSVHIAVLDTEADRDRFEDQVAWLEADLAAARVGGARWLFISMHRPIWATATGSENQRWAYELLPIIARHGVDAVFWGHDHMHEHYEYRYGANGYVFDPADSVAENPTHFFTVGTIGARVDSLYPGFFTHRPFAEQWEMYDPATGLRTTLQFSQRPWNTDYVKRDQPGVRYQDPAAYPAAASYYSYPFDSAADALAGRYSTDPLKRYSDDAEFFGYTY
ncbi:MAG: metallophosphoesterase family protein, partial [Spirochaetia bacterium]